MWRLLPAYFVVMLLMASVHSQNIENSWANILYINNFLPIQQQFMPWTWSLAIEEQFYIIFPFLILLIFRSQYPLTILISLLVLSFVIRYLLVIYYQFQLPLPFHEVLNKELHYQYFDKIYDKTYARYGGLIIGVLAAYGMIYRNWVEYLNRRLLLRRSLLLITVLLLLAYLRVPTLVENVTVNETALLLALFRNVFSLAIGYLILYSLTIQGRNNFIIRCFSGKFWYPIAQLSYSAYLIHLMVVAGIAINRYQDLKPSFMLVISLIFITSLLSLSLAAIIFITVEKPLLQLRNCYFPRV